MQQKRLIIALVLSSAILFLWSYFYPGKPPENPQPAPAASPTATATPATTQSAQNSQSQQPSSSQSSPTVPQGNAPRRVLTVRTPLYDIKFDSQGAEPISWIIKKNKSKEGEKEIFSVAGRSKERIPLELISPEGLNRQPRQVPLQIHTDDAAFDAAIAAATYKVEGVDGTTGDLEINLTAGQKKQISFLLDDGGAQIKKTVVFDADRYTADLSVLLQRNGQAVPHVKLSVGPSIGDQGIGHHSFYSVAPEAVSFVGTGVVRHTADAINRNKNSPDHLNLNGPVNWAGVGDTYFAMVATPLGSLEGLEYRTVAYEYKPNGKKDKKRFFITRYVPVPSDGGRTLIYAGPKDHYLLEEASREITSVAQRQVDLDGLIDYGYLSMVSRPIAVPILKAISFLYRITNSYGLAIILFTIVIYSLFFPLKWRSSKSMKKAQKLAPKMKELQEKIKGMKQNDPRLKELQVEQLRLMKEGNPLGGCLPLLIQMAFLFALYRAITISLDFR